MTLGADTDGQNNGAFDLAELVLGSGVWLRRLSGDHDTGMFKPWDFLDCTVEEGYGGAHAEQLLHQGAAVALLSWLMDWWEQGWPAGDPATYRAALEAGRFDHLPAARAAVVAGLDGPDSMHPFPSPWCSRNTSARSSRRCRALLKATCSAPSVSSAAPAPDEHDVWKRVVCDTRSRLCLRECAYACRRRRCSSKAAVGREAGRTIS
jgi:hypothetical protein